MPVKGTGVETKEDFRERTVEDEGGCWIWQRYVRRDGYGWLWFKGKMQLANRVAWQLFRGEIPEGMHVLHNVADGCVGKACVNPDCLRLGTAKENNNDADTVGTARWNATVPDKIVETTIRRYRNGITQTELVKWLRLHGYKAARPTISCWVNGKSRPDCLERVLQAME